MKLLFVDALTNNFKGRASRKEYWQFLLERVVIYLVASTPVWVIAQRSDFIEISLLERFAVVFAVLCYFLLLSLFIPSRAVSVRRLHDIGKSGWHWFISLIPLVGWIVMLFWMCRKGESGTNKYGPNPLSMDG
ncbi:MAG: DUF805 domain-containing protein [Simkaniaceae bacterium]|nr:DUF805 domain-containing protein [Simkaniaceae bacterium]